MKSISNRLELKRVVLACSKMADSQSTTTSGMAGLSQALLAKALEDLSPDVFRVLLLEEDE